MPRTRHVQGSSVVWAAALFLTIAGTAPGADPTPPKDPAVTTGTTRTG
ncbi:hypothetical protein [Sphaerisporangium corydalis]|uniref:Uncharacterized protein n=1 Tax=Sphaerisporangium corydalis TaxID=1441875 RepID=A0ABV9EBF4_9ACTN|nr:hypothetical protein [Sphaerisporangium corydalis]